MLFSKIPWFINVWSWVNPKILKRCNPWRNSNAHTYTSKKAKLYFLFMCLGAVKPFQQHRARHKCGETEETLRDLLLLRQKLVKAWRSKKLIRGSKKLVPVSARVCWMIGTLEGKHQEGQDLLFALFCATVFLNHSESM